MLNEPALRGEQARGGALCPLRPGQPCTLCHPDAHNGPQDCPTVAIVMDDPELRTELARKRAEYRERTGVGQLRGSPAGW